MVEPRLLNMQVNHSVNLPSEIINRIFHFGALQSTKFCATLSLTCTWARHFVLPYLYRTLAIESLISSRSLLNSLGTVSICPPFYDFYPKAYPANLWISAVSNLVLGIFRNCDNLTNLALHADNFYWIVHASSPSEPFRNNCLAWKTISQKPDLKVLLFNIKRNDWSLRKLVPQDETKMSPIFNKITHLRLEAIGNYSSQLNITHFNRLSNFAVPYYDPENQQFCELDTLLSQRRFDRFVLVVYEAELEEEYRTKAREWVKSRRAQGDAYVHVWPSSRNAIQDEWEDEVRKDLSIWKKAESYTADNIDLDAQMFISHDFRAS